MANIKLNGNLIKLHAKFETLTHAEPVTYNDWFLPSTLAVLAMQTELYEQSVGNFTGNLYWTSSEDNTTPTTTARVVNMSIHNSTGGLLKSSSHYVRACRSFAGAPGLYTLRAVGPGGGLIFAYTGGLYYEAAPSDQSTGYVWSDVTNLATGATGAQFTDSITNTNLILGQVGFTDGAAKLCDDLVIIN